MTKLCMSSWQVWHQPGATGRDKAPLALDAGLPVQWGISRTTRTGCFLGLCIFVDVKEFPRPARQYNALSSSLMSWFSSISFAGGSPKSFSVPAFVRRMYSWFYLIVMFSTGAGNSSSMSRDES